MHFLIEQVCYHDRLVAFQVREMLTRLSAIRVSVALDIGKQDNLMQAWNSFVPVRICTITQALVFVFVVLLH
jgi:hypothetical protein